MKIILKFGEVAAIGFDGITREPAFDTEMIQITLDQGIGVHAAMIANHSYEDNANRDAANLDTP